jgi:hypothetical protein
MTWNKGTDLVVATNAALSVTGAVTMAPGIAVNKSGDGTATLRNVRAGDLSIEGGTLAVAADGTSAATSKVVSLTIDSGKIDLANNKLIVSAGSVGSATGGVYDGVSGAIQSAHNGGAWDGDGITTSMPDAASGLTALGIATADQAGYAGGAFGAVSVAASDVLVMYTYDGDANLDGLISGDDYSAIDFNILVAGSSGWYNGDFNYDGIISGDDYSAIDFNILAQGAPFPTSVASSLAATTAVPEPAAMAATCALVAILPHRCRSQPRHARG